jgi:hypothetical protein
MTSYVNGSRNVTGIQRKDQSLRYLKILTHIRSSCPNWDHIPHWPWWQRLYLYVQDVSEHTNFIQVAWHSAHEVRNDKSGFNWVLTSHTCVFVPCSVITFFDCNKSDGRLLTMADDHDAAAYTTPMIGRRGINTNRVVKCSLCKGTGHNREYWKKGCIGVFRRMKSPQSRSDLRTKPSRMRD